MFKTVASVSIGVVAAFGPEGAKDVSQAAFSLAYYATGPHRLFRDIQELVTTMGTALDESLKQHRNGDVPDKTAMNDTKREAIEQYSARLGELVEQNKENRDPQTTANIIREVENIMTELQTVLGQDPERSKAFSKHLALAREALTAMTDRDVDGYFNHMMSAGYHAIQAITNLDESSDIFQSASQTNLVKRAEPFMGMLKKADTPPNYPIRSARFVIGTGVAERVLNYILPDVASENNRGTGQTVTT